MNKKPTIYVFSQKDFETYCKTMHYTDEEFKMNKGLAEGLAFISIIGTVDCLKYYLDEENTTHFFKESHNFVKNLEFDDLDSDLNWKGHTFKAMTQEQANDLFDFIDNNIGNTFIIHCRAGQSRSAAVGQFIKDFYNDVYGSINNNWSTYNHCVYRLLARAYYEKYGTFSDKHD